MEGPELGRGLGSVVERPCSWPPPRRPEFESSSAGKRKRSMTRTCATRRTAVAVTGRVAAGVLCLVLRFCVCPGARGWGRGLGKMEETRHPSHRRYRWWSGMLKGAVAGASPTGPWTDRRTGVRTPDHDERQPWRIPLDRPCLLPVLVQKSYRENVGQSLLCPPTHCMLPGTRGYVPELIPDRPDVKGPSRHGWGAARQPREGCTASDSRNCGYFT